MNQRERFNELAQQAFSESIRDAGRSRFQWTLPFNLFVLGLLWTHGAPGWRVATQGVVAFVCVTWMAFFKVHVRRQQWSALVGILAFLASIANTGGIASPLVMTGAPLLIGIALNPSLGNWRRRLLGTLIGGFFVLAIFSRTACGQLYAPLTLDAQYSSREYVLISTVSFVFSAFVIQMIGRRMMRVYERVGIELAERREQLCSEGTERTMALEGIAARLAHEVKNPLAAIRGLSSHMAKSAEDSKVKERLSIVAGEAERLQEIVDGFLSFSRGLDDLKASPTRPHEIAREIALLLETRAHDAEQTLEVKGSPELAINADPRKLRQAILNLVLNAMQASGKDQVVTIEIAKRCEGAACVRVIDRGAGMSPEVLARIAKPYFTTKEGGSGLGIAIARGLVEQHGGRLRFESQPGRGTTAIIELPPCAIKATGGLEKKLPNPARVAAH